MGRIGDFVLMLSALRLLIDHYGQANTVLVISPSVEAIARREFPDVRCLKLPAEASGVFRHLLPIWWHQRPQFSRDHFGHCISLRHQRSLYHEVSLSWIKAARDFRLTRSTYPAAATIDTSTELLAHQTLVAHVLNRTVTTTEILPRFTKIPIGDDGRLIIYPLSVDTRRCLSVEQITTVLKLWRKKCSAPIVLGGSPTEVPRLTPYLEAVRATGIEGITMETPAGVDAFVRHIAEAGAILASESGTAHIATALDKRAVIMTGGGYQGLCYPWRRSERQITVQNQLPCFGCDWHCHHPKMYCLTQLPLTQAADALPVLS